MHSGIYTADITAPVQQGRCTAAKITWASLKVCESSQAPDSYQGIIPSGSTVYTLDFLANPGQLDIQVRLAESCTAAMSVSRTAESWKGIGAGKGESHLSPLRRRVFEYVLGARARARNLGLQVSLLERTGIGAVAGGIAGGFTNATLHPIDTVKTKLQTRGASQLYSGPFDVVSKVLATQGICGLYCGVQAAFVGSVMSSSVYFGTYEFAKGVFSSVSVCPQTMIPPLAAALGNITSSAFLVPKEVIKQRMQAGAVGSTKEVLLHTIQNDGFGGLYAGYSAALLRNLPSNIISFSTFEYLKMAWLRTSKKSFLEPWQSVVSGALAGVLSAAATTPLDVVKTRLMTQARLHVLGTGVSGMKAEAAARAQVIAAYTYTGVSSTLKQIWIEEGLPGLMKGVGPRVFYSACFSAMGFFAFESTRALLLMKHINSRTQLKAIDMKPL